MRNTDEINIKLVIICGYYNYIIFGRSALMSQWSKDPIMHYIIIGWGQDMVNFINSNSSIFINYQLINCHTLLMICALLYNQYNQQQALLVIVGINLSLKNCRWWIGLDGRINSKYKLVVFVVSCVVMTMICLLCEAEHHTWVTSKSNGYDNSKIIE